MSEDGKIAEMDAQPNEQMMDGQPVDGMDRGGIASANSFNQAR